MPSTTKGRKANSKKAAIIIAVIFLLFSFDFKNFDLEKGEKLSPSSLMNVYLFY